MKLLTNTVFVFREYSEKDFEYNNVGLHSIKIIITSALLEASESCSGEIDLSNLIKIRLSAPQKHSI